MLKSEPIKNISLNDSEDLVVSTAGTDQAKKIEELNTTIKEVCVLHNSCGIN